MPVHHASARRPTGLRLGARLWPPLLSAALGCDEVHPPLPARGGDAGVSAGPDVDGGGAVALINEPFSDIYRLFLMPQIPANVKSARWNTNYQGRWVSWTGKLVASSRNSAKFKQLQQTITFDVSLLVNRNAGSNPERMRVGQYYRYFGRLRSYDDVFRTMYLDQGTIVATSEQASGELVPVPPPLRYYPGAP